MYDILVVPLFFVFVFNKARARLEMAKKKLYFILKILTALRISGEKV